MTVLLVFVAQLCDDVDEIDPQRCDAVGPNMETLQKVFSTNLHLISQYVMEICCRLWITGGYRSTYTSAAVPQAAEVITLPPAWRNRQTKAETSWWELPPQCADACFAYGHGDGLILGVIRRTAAG